MGDQNTMKKPETYWEERCLALEICVEQLIDIIHLNLPGTYTQTSKLVREWNRVTEEIEQEYNAEMGGQAAKGCSPDSLVGKRKSRICYCGELVPYRTACPKCCNAKPTGCEDNEHSVGRIVEAVKALGFEECESDEDDACEKCGKPCQPLYFGNADYWDCREGDYWCGQCVLKFHEANQQDYAEAMLNATADRMERQATLGQADGCDNSGGKKL
jgi:hypothetical protein